MPGFSSLDDLINELTTNGKVYERPFGKLSTAPEAAGVWHSLWTAAGQPGAGAAPAGTPGTQYDDTAGSIFFPDQASDQKHLVGLEVVASQICTLMLYDRLVAVSGLSTASTGNRTVSSAALPRYTDGIGVEAWLEVTTATTTTAPIIDMNSYTDNDGNAAQDGPPVTFPAVATNVDALIQLPLATGDLGVRACSTINVNTASAAGVVNFVLLKPLLFIGLMANISNAVNLVTDLMKLSRLFDGASLALAFKASSTTTVSFEGLVTAAYG